MSEIKLKDLLAKNINYILLENVEIFSSEDLFKNLKILSPSFFEKHPIDNYKTKKDSISISFSINGKSIGIMKNKIGKFDIIVAGNIKRNIFFEDIMPIIESKIKSKKSHLFEYLPGDLSNRENKIKKSEIGKSIMQMKNFATTVGTVIQSLSGRYQAVKELILGLMNKYEDFEKVTDNQTFMSELQKIDSNSYSLFKKAKSDVLRNFNKK